MGTLNCICGHRSPSDLTLPLTEIRCEACGRNLMEIMFESAEPILRLPRTVDGMLDLVIGMVVKEVIRAGIEGSDQLTKREKRTLLKKLYAESQTLTRMGE